MDCAEFKSDICKGWKICLDLLLKGVQHLGGFHFFESDSLVECSQKFRVFAEGWATYIEPFAYQYAAGYIKDPSATELA